MPTGRPFSGDEIHAIFERAAARQEAAQQAEEASRSGLTLEELQAIGAEAGIDPEHVARAAVEVGSGTPAVFNVDRSILGIPTLITRTRKIPVRVPDDAWGAAVRDLREIFGAEGIAGAVGSSREWAVRAGIGKSDKPVKVTLTPEGEDTLVSISQELRGHAIGFTIATATYAVMALLLVSLSLLGANVPLGLGLVFLGFAGLFWGGIQVGTRIHATRQRDRFERALDRIEQIALASGPSPADRHAEPPALALDPVEPAPEQESLPAGRNRTRA